MFENSSLGKEVGVTQEKLLRWGWGIGRNDECWVRAPHTFLCCVTKEYVPGEAVRMWRQQSIQRVRQIIWLDCLSHCFLSLYRAFKNRVQRRFTKVVSLLARLSLFYDSLEDPPGLRVLRA